MRKFLKFLGYGFLILLLGLLLPMVFMIPGGVLTVVEIESYLMLGWISFVKRVAPEIELNGDLIGMALTCGILILAISHGFLCWIAKACFERTEATSVKKWSFKWTFCLNGILFLFFLSGCPL